MMLIIGISLSLIAIQLAPEDAKQFVSILAPTCFWLGILVLAIQVRLKRGHHGL